MLLMVGKWWSVAAATLALVLGNGPVMQFTFGVFIQSLSQEFGASRQEISLALTIGLTLTGVCLPAVGWLVDRYGARNVTVPAIALFALSLYLVTRATNLTEFYIGFACMGVAAAGQTPLPYSRVIARRFDANRGLALGIAMAGVGIGTALLPKFAAELVALSTWRSAYFWLAMLVAVVAVPSAIAALGEEPQPRSNASPSSAVLPGSTALAAIGRREFWFMAAAFFLSTLCSAGLLAHVVPLLADVGVPQTEGVAAIGAAGLALIIGRILSGYLVDRFPPTIVAASFFGGQALGIAILILWVPSVPLAILASILVGLGLGAEVDLLGFMLSRIFGLRAFGVLYGILFGIFMIAGGIGPLILGAAYARFGGYSIGLVVLEVALVGAIAAVLQLGGAMKIKPTSLGVPTHAH